MSHDDFMTEVKNLGKRNGFRVSEFIECYVHKVSTLVASDDINKPNPVVQHELVFAFDSCVAELKTK